MGFFKTMKSKFICSSIALVLGVLTFIGSISNIANGNTQTNPLVGAVMILGSLAYISLKRRRLGKYLKLLHWYLS